MNESRRQNKRKGAKTRKPSKKATNRALTILEADRRAKELAIDVDSKIKAKLAQILEEMLARISALEERAGVPGPKGERGPGWFETFFGV
jgi:ribosome assembly protein YihI (activator of Der GTPase)